MQLEEFITIIIPVYNGEHYIGRCINSVMSQSYPHFEVVVIDDGSTDETAKILKCYADTFQNIKIFQTEHKGVSYARNYGISLAKGKYIAFVDADDEIAPNFLEVLYRIIKEKNAQIAVCGLYHVNTSRACASVESVAEQIVSNVPEITVTDGRGFLRRMEEPLRYEITAVCWNKLYDKTIFMDKKYPKGKIYEDSAMMQELLYPVKRLAETQEKLYFYHTETCGITRSAYSKDKLDEVVYAKRRMLFFFKKKEWELYTLARKQYCIALLKHFYLLKKSGLGDDRILSRIRQQQNKYLKGFRWKRQLPLKVRILFDAGVYIPYLCGAFIVAWDNFLEKKYRIHRNE